MGHGEIEQTGQPQEIFRTPRSRFVAEFVGRNNILLASQPGQEIVVAADRMQVSDHAPEGMSIKAGFLSEEFAGTGIICYFETDDGTELKAQVSEEDLRPTVTRTGKNVLAKLGVGSRTRDGGRIVDILVKGGVLPNGVRADIAISGDRISAVEPDISGEAGLVVDAGGKLISTPFVDAHFHMDATLSYGHPRVNTSGTLLEGIGLWGELKQIQTREDIVARALTYCRQAVAKGILAIRSHVDVTDKTFNTVEALLEVRETVRDVLDLQLVAFPQDGWYRASGAEAAVIRALDAGVDIVGGIPHFERTMADGAASVRAACELAAERGLRVDLHCDESDDPHSRHIETLAAETIRCGLQGRVAGSHLTSMHSMDNYYVAKLLPLIAEAQVAAIPNPLINITLQGRMDTYPKRRGQTRVPELRAAGVTVAFGQDCVRDPWYPLGSGDMLEVAHMGLHVGLMTSPDQMCAAYDMVTTAPAQIMGMDFGLRPGCRASLIVLDAPDRIEALRLRPARLAVISNGKLVSTTQPAETEQSLGF